MIIYVARHGETDWNQEGRYQGQRESHLTATGRAQAEALADALGLEPLERVVSSPLARCRDTAAPLARRARVAIEEDARLIEIAHGTWESRLRVDIEREDGERMRRWREHPETVQFQDGESLDDVLQRWRSFTSQLRGDGDIAIVTHDVLVRIAILDATNRPLAHLWKARVVNGGFARFAVEGGEWRLLDECVEAHLAGLHVNTQKQAL